MTLQADPQPLSEAEYANRLLPAREAKSDVGSTLLAAGAIVMGLTALFFTPFKPGFIGIFLAVMSNALSNRNDKLPKIALAVATLGWLIGGILSVLYDEAVW